MVFSSDTYFLSKNYLWEEKKMLQIWLRVCLKWLHIRIDWVVESGHTIENWPWLVINRYPFVSVFKYFWDNFVNNYDHSTFINIFYTLLMHFMGTPLNVGARKYISDIMLKNNWYFKYMFKAIVVSGVS